MMRRIGLTAALVMMLGLRAGANVQTPALAEMAEKFEQGLTLTFETAGGKDVRTERLIALDVPAGEAPTPFLDAAAFKATWTGNLVSRSRDTIAFSAAGRGTVKISLNDQPALEVSGENLAGKAGAMVPVKKGKNKLVVEYSSPASGAAEVRVFWRSDSFPTEPIPPMVFSHDVSDVALRTQERMRAGRTLFGELRCVKCHDGKGVMPELGMDAPSLAEVGSRLNEGYMAEWIANPRALRPQARMPRVVHEMGEAKDIAAYLATMGKPAGEGAAGDDAAVTAGTRLFTGLGCIACHTTPDAEKADSGRLPLNIVRAKWQGGALAAYLKQPEKTYAWTRMPNFRLSDAEAGELAAYLLAKSPAGKAAGGGDAKHGETLFASAGCMNCHGGAGVNQAKAPALLDLMQTDWMKGCMAKEEAGRGKAPDFGLDDEQRGALLAFAATGGKSLGQDNGIEVAERQFAAANCSACHMRDNLGDNWSDLKEEIGQIEAGLPAAADTGEKYAPDQSRPPLTWVGEKLRAEWMEKFIGGKVGYKPRPYIYARMPGFASRAPMLAAGFAEEHGYAPVSEPIAKPVADLVPIGQRLVGKAGGFSCNTCHSIADVPALAAFEAPAPNFAHVAERLRHDYYVRWVRNPQRVERGTRMPTFERPDGQTPVKDVLGGDGAKQFDAIWNYLLQGNGVQPPQG